MIGRLYERIWRGLGLRQPITDYCRDGYHRYPLLVILAVSLVSGPLWLFVPLWIVGIIYGACFIGIVLGHFFWASARRWRKVPYA